MLREFIIKKGDTFPAMVVTVRDALGLTVPLDGCTVRFWMREVGHPESLTVDDGNATVSGASLVYDWSDGGTNAAGVFEAEFRVHWDGDESGRFTVPTQGYLCVRVVDTVS